jgi:hypothetical protein
MNTPPKRLNGAGSSSGRWWGISRIMGAEGDHETVYMTRIWMGPLRFHIFHRGDQDPDCHDHPWDFWTFPLVSYVEEVLHPIRDTIPEIPGSKLVFRKVEGVDEIYREYENGDEAFVTRDRYYRRLEVVEAFKIHHRPATHQHRVLGAFDPRFYSQKQRVFPPANIPTIVWRGPVRRPWGFTKERNGRWCWVAWKKYVYDGGKHGPCE